MNYNENSKPTLESTILNSIRGSLVDTHTTLIAKITKINAGQSVADVHNNVLKAVT
jgi:hypothetical protein